METQHLPAGHPAIELCSEIGIPADRDQCDTFGSVLHEIGVDALAHEREQGHTDDELVAAPEVIGAAFQRVRATESDACPTAPPATMYTSDERFHS